MSESFLDESLYRLDDLMQHIFRNLYRKIRQHVTVEITESQFALCKLVKRRGRMTVSELADALGVSLSAVTVTADRLCRAGLLERQRDQNDRRVVWLALTAHGDRVVSEMLEVWYRTVKSYFARLPAGDVEKLVSICERLVEIARADDEAGAEQERVQVEGEEG